MRVDIGGGTRLFFDVVGSSLESRPDEMAPRPVLLVLHGGPGSDHSAMRPWFDRFSNTHQVVYLDHRGQGRSDQRRVADEWNLDTWADDVVRFCDALEIERPLVLGHSFGGGVAMHYAGRHPEHPSGVVLSSAEARLHLDAVLDAFERLGGADARNAAAESFAEPTSEDRLLRYNERCLPLYNRSPRPDPGASRREWTNYRVLSHWAVGEQKAFDLRSSISSITCPTLVFAGADDPRCPVATFDEIVGLLKDAHVDVTAHLLGDCGHGTYRDKPEETESILRSWLANRNT